MTYINNIINYIIICNYIQLLYLKLKHKTKIFIHTIYSTFRLRGWNRITDIKLSPK